MMNRPSFLRSLAPLCATTLLLGGCAAFRTKVSDVPVDDDQHMDATYDYSDLRNLTAKISGELLASPFLAKHAEPPVFVVSTVEPKTRKFVETQPLTDKIKRALIQSGKARFVSKIRRDELLKEQDYQWAHVAPEQRVAIGRQLGAKYMLSGTLIEMTKKSGRQVRVSSRELVYYSLTMEVTDLQTGQIVWITEKEFARQARKPLIGW